MKSKRLLLLKTMLLSTSRINKLKHCKDKKKRNQAIGTMVGMSVIYIMLVLLCTMMSAGYGRMGLCNAVPIVCAATISIVAFVFTLFKTNGYLINFKEYDMIMSLPFEAKNIVAVKFLYMYIQNIPWFLSVSVAMLIGYGIYEKPVFFVYLLWFVLSFVLPVIPMLAATFIGFIVAKISAGFKKTNLVQTIIMFAVILLCFLSQFIANAVSKNDEMDVVLDNISDKIDSLGDYYILIKWFKSAIVDLHISDILLLIGISLLLFEIVFAIVGKSYRRINSAMKSHAASKSFTMKENKENSVLQAIAFKEFKRLTGSTTYMVNVVIGEILALILGIAVLIVGFDKIVGEITKGAPLSVEMLYPAIPLIVHFLVGMVASTCCSPSLEGKNYWIVQSLPIDKKVLYQGKMLFNMYLTVPFALFATACISVSAGVPVLNLVVSLIGSIVLCAASSVWGLVCGLKFIRLDWENEIEVIKQGAGVIVYLMPNMLVTVGLIAFSVFLGTIMDDIFVLLIVTAIYLLLTIIGYFLAISMVRKQK